MTREAFSKALRPRGSSDGRRSTAFDPDGRSGIVEAPDSPFSALTAFVRICTDENSSLQVLQGAKFGPC